jgi:hypothetical protein
MSEYKILIFVRNKLSQVRSKIVQLVWKHKQVANGGFLQNRLENIDVYVVLHVTHVASN